MMTPCILKRDPVIGCLFLVHNWYYWVEVRETSNSQNGNTCLLTEESISEHIEGIVFFLIFRTPSVRLAFSKTSSRNEQAFSYIEIADVLIKSSVLMVKVREIM